MSGAGGQSDRSGLAVEWNRRLRELWQADIARALARIDPSLASGRMTAKALPPGVARYTGDYNAAATYRAGDIVHGADGRDYRAIVATSADPTTGSPDWLQVAEPPLGSPASGGEALVSTAAGVRSWAAKQDEDADLTAIAALTPADDDLIQRKAGAWTNRTPAQLVADLIALSSWVEAVQDVIGAMVAAAGGSYDDATAAIAFPSGELGQYVQGTAPSSPATGAIWLDTASSPPDMATQAELDAAVAGLQPLDPFLSELAAVALPDGSYISRVGGTVSARDAAQVKGDLSLNNVPNLKVNLAAATNPASTDDNTQGYAIGSFWLDASHGKLYVCISAATNAAVWVRIDNSINTINPGSGISLSSVSDGAWGFDWTIGNSAGPILLAESTVGVGGAASITFSSIPQIYRGLLVTFSALSDSGVVAVNVRFNGDATANYDWERLIATATTLTGGEAIGASSLRIGSMANVAGAFSSAEARISEYTRTDRQKVVIAHGARIAGNATGNIIIERDTGTWRTTGSAITSVTFIPDSGNFAQDSVFRLFGLP